MTTKDDQTLAEYLDVKYPARAKAKPRTSGLTMIMDQAWPVNFTEGVLEAWGDYIDVVKLWDPHLLQPVSCVRAKVEAYLRHDVIVQPGGLFLEIARRSGPVGDLMKRLRELGFDAIEISSTTSTRSDMTDDVELVKHAQDLGFMVFGEVGRKFPDGDETRLTADTLDIEATIHEFRTLLDAGARYVYWEGHLLRKVLGDTPTAIKAQAATGSRDVAYVAREIGIDNIMFEVSGLRPQINRQWLQFWLVRLFGPSVNIANARIEEMGNLEAIRSGNHPIFGFGGDGNYAWLNASADADGQPAP